METTKYDLRAKKIRKHERVIKEGEESTRITAEGTTEERTNDPLIHFEITGAEKTNE